MNGFFLFGEKKLVKAGKRIVSRAKLFKAGLR